MHEEFNEKLYHRYYVNKNAFYQRKDVKDKEIVDKLTKAYNSDVLTTKAEDIDFTEIYAIINMPERDIIVFKEYKNTVAVLEEHFLTKPDYGNFTKIELLDSSNSEVMHTITDPEKIKFIVDNVSDYYYDDDNSKGYHIAYVTKDGERVHHVAYIKEIYFKKHNIL